MITVIKNANIVTKEAVITGKVLLIEDGIIKGIEDSFAPCLEVIDADGGFVIPGFIDLHIHGGDGYEFMDATPEAIRGIEKFHLANGTTTMLATTLTAPDDETRTAIQTLDEYIQSNPDSTIIGIHLEGPWLNPLECGAQNAEFIRGEKSGELSALKSDFPTILRVSAAPEIEGGMALGDEARECGVVTSCAHTSANFAEIGQAISHGYTLMTHLYSGMRGVWRENSYRIAGAVEGGLYYDGMFVELISDGKHLPEELLRFVYKIKGADRICLITDAIRAAGMPNGSETVIGSFKNGLRVIVEDDVAKLTDRQSFAGSTSNMRRQFYNILKATDGNIIDTVKMASTTPAALMKLTDRGEIAVGKRADLLIIKPTDEEIKILKVIKGGQAK